MIAAVVRSLDTVFQTWLSIISRLSAESDTNVVPKTIKESIIQLLAMNTQFCAQTEAIDE